MIYVGKIIGFFLIAISPLGYSQVIETWECKEYRDRVWNVVVLADVLAQGNIGRIRVAGIVHRAHFQVRGFNRRWDFGVNNYGNFDYAFVIKPDGTANYYEFSGAQSGQEVAPAHTLQCVPVPYR